MNKTAEIAIALYDSHYNEPIAVFTDDDEEAKKDWEERERKYWNDKGYHKDLFYFITVPLNPLTNESKI